MLYTTILNTKIGKLLAKMTNDSVVGLEFADISLEEQKINIPLFKKLESWINNYFDGKNPEIDFKIETNGTDFQNKVWKIVSKINYGKTVTYTDIANTMGNKNLVRAVGQAMKRNPIILLIPCHRIIGKNSIGGYCGRERLNIKEYLLDLEKQVQ